MRNPIIDIHSIERSICSIRHEKATIDVVRHLAYALSMERLWGSNKLRQRWPIVEQWSSQARRSGLVHQMVLP